MTGASGSSATAFKTPAATNEFTAENAESAKENKTT
jgi:hypothetical protein